jgi:sulfide:quinone oxidoreductase
MKDENLTYEVLVVGGGVAGVEATLALRDMAGDRCRVTMVSDRPEFVMKPLTVEEPFSGLPAPRYELAPLLDKVGGRLVTARIKNVHPADKLVELDDGSKLRYDALMVCLGARATEPFSTGTTLSATDPVPVAELIAKAAAHPSRTVSVVIPPGNAWPLPAYEFALRTQRRAREIGVYGLRVELVTPEDAPLAIFGPAASAGVSELLKARAIEFRGQTSIEEVEGSLISHPGGEEFTSGAVVAMPRLEGPALPGLPQDPRGFIPTDLHGRVKGTPDVWAAGDGTAFPVKQGGLAAEQADAAAASIARSLGAPLHPEPFEPVLRGQLLTGEDSLHMNNRLGGGAGGGEVSPDCLWWPPNKVAGRYLPTFLSYEGAIDDPTPPREPMAVKYAMDPGSGSMPTMEGRL